MTRSRKRHLAFTLIFTPIFVFAIGVDEPDIPVSGLILLSVLSGGLAYFVLLPFFQKISDALDRIFTK
ncbi:MAG: hypothetical protein HY506_00350 [Candidatus Yanofskybacteria bacterium]|nr:hypothetical protein [Candidatus Yanofskybacteria bacterium]